MIKGEKVEALREYVFTEDLMNAPVVVSAVRYNKQFINMIETLPVFTMRGDVVKQEIIAVNKNWTDGFKAHKQIIKGKSK